MLEKQITAAFAMLCFMAGCETTTARTKLVVDSRKSQNSEASNFIKEGLGCKSDQEYIMPEGGKLTCVSKDMIAGL